MEPDGDDGRVDDRELEGGTRGKWRFYFLGRIINSFFHVRKVGGGVKQETAYWSFQSWNVPINCRLYFVNFRSLKLFSLAVTPSSPLCIPSPVPVLILHLQPSLNYWKTCLNNPQNVFFDEQNRTNFKNHTHIRQRIQPIWSYFVCVSSKDKSDRNKYDNSNHYLLLSIC